MRLRPIRGLGRTNLIWLIGIAAGVLAGGIVAYTVASGSQVTAASAR